MKYISEHTRSFLPFFCNDRNVIDKITTYNYRRVKDFTVDEEKIVKPDQIYFPKINGFML